MNRDAGSYLSLFKGNIDNITTSGFIYGWAFDEDAPHRPVRVRIATDQGADVALGYAHHFREDLADVGYGYGWCAFRLRLLRSLSAVRRSTLTLCAGLNGDFVMRLPAVQIVEEAEVKCLTVDDVLLHDPTALTSIKQLRGCEKLLTTFIARHGVAEFVRGTYVYVLARPADDEGLASYSRLIRSGAMSPFGLIAALADSEEFRSRPRFLAPPNTPGFAFNS